MVSVEDKTSVQIGMKCVVKPSGAGGGAPKVAICGSPGVEEGAPLGGYTYVDQLIDFHKCVSEGEVGAGEAVEL